MKAPTIMFTYLNDDGYDLIKELPSTSNEWTKTELAHIAELLKSGESYLNIGDRCYIIKQ